ncbi:MAG: hypothetical protein STHCBS139747_002451 [Sporothrix thermara]
MCRASAVAFLHDYEAMIDINPLVTDRHRIPPPRDADPDEAACVWYRLTDAVAMPWSTSPSPKAGADSTTAKSKPGNVSYTCTFHPLPDGLQTHCRAPLGVDIRNRWTVGGNEPGEPRQPVELGLDALGAPASGLYLREDVELRCNRLMAGFTLNNEVAMAVSPMDNSPITKPSSLSVSSPALTQKPTPPRVQPPQKQQQKKPYRPLSQQYTPSSYSPSEAHQQYQQHRQQQQQQPHHIGRQHQHSHSYPNNLPPSKLPPSSNMPVAASQAAGSLPLQQNKSTTSTLQAQQQNQHNQRSLHPLFPQADGIQSRISTEPSSLSSSPSPQQNPPAVRYDQLNLTASPLTRLQLQLPRVSASSLSLRPMTTPAAEMGDTSVNIKSINNNQFSEKQQRHTLYQQLLPPLIFSAQEVVSSEPRRKSTGSDSASASETSIASGSSSISSHDINLCPSTLRIGGQVQQPANSNTSRPSVPALPVQTYLPFQPLRSAQEAPQMVVVNAAKAHSEETAEEKAAPAGQVAPAKPQIAYPEMSPYISNNMNNNDDEYEDILVFTPISASDSLMRQNGLYPPIDFAEFDDTIGRENSAAVASSGAAPLPEWQQRRKFLSQDTP